MISWAGRLIVLVGAGHLLIALTLYARPHLGAWFSGALWGEDLAAMSNAGTALWLTIDSFSVPLILVGLTILWLDRRGLAPPSFLGWTVGAWAVIEAVIFGPSPSWLLPVSAALLLVGGWRSRRQESHETQGDRQPSDGLLHRPPTRRHDDAEATGGQRVQARGDVGHLGHNQPDDAADFADGAEQPKPNALQ